MQPGKLFREAIKEERPLQCIGTMNAYHARLAEAVGYRSLYVSGGGVAAAADERHTLARGASPTGSCDATLQSPRKRAPPVM